MVDPIQEWVISTSKIMAIGRKWSVIEIMISCHDNFNFLIHGSFLLLQSTDKEFPFCYFVTHLM
jgi:hypothetical protein